MLTEENLNKLIKETELRKDVLITLLKSGLEEGTIIALRKVKMSDQETRVVTEDVLLTIAQWQPYVDKMNNFLKTGTVQLNLKDNASVYNPQDHSISINPLLLKSSDNIILVHQLAHEVMHSSQDYSKINDATAVDFSNDLSKLEGGALFFEFLALTNLYTLKTGYMDFYPLLWKDDSNHLTNDKKENSENLYKKIFKIVYGVDIENKSLEEIQAIIKNINPELNNAITSELAEMNKEMIMGNINGIPITYDEFNKWDWITQKTYFADNYMEAWGENFPISEKWHEVALNAILNSESHSYNIKVLLNQYNNYLGNEENNKELKINENGSTLGKINGYEILWGSMGNDTLNGNNTNDILLGGGDNDHLYGGEGNDTYIVGEGFDIISDSNNDATLIWQNLQK